jgi:hypothetical protein
MKRFSIVAAAMLMAACADTGPMKVGKDTYTISTRVAFDGPAGAKGEAIKEANQYCGSLHKQVLLQNETSHECALHGGCGEAEITFMCLDENDPRYSAQSPIR